MDKIAEVENEIKLLNTHKIMANCQEKLDEHRTNYHMLIDDFFKRKSSELNQFINETLDEQRTTINGFKIKLTEPIREQYEFLKSAVDNVQLEVSNLKELSNQIIVQPLKLNNNLIQFSNSKKTTFDLINLSPIYKTINHPHGTHGLITNNKQYLLAYLTPNFILIDQQLNIVKQVQWLYDSISNICWSSRLDRFLVITQKTIYLINDRTMSIENLDLTDKSTLWFSCTCSDTSIFLSTNETASSIVEFQLSPSIKLIKRWTTPDTCSHSEYIDHIVYHNSKLAIVISNKLDRSVRMELRSSNTFQRIWSFQFEIFSNHTKPFRCCLINSDEWIIADYKNQRLLQITNDGNLKSTIPYYSTPFHIVNFNFNFIVIARTNGYNLHKLS